MTNYILSPGRRRGNLRRLAVEHLTGLRCLRFYLTAEDNKVSCSCIDLANKPDQPNPI